MTRWWANSKWKEETSIKTSFDFVLENLKDFPWNSNDSHSIIAITRHFLPQLLIKPEMFQHENLLKSTKHWVRNLSRSHIHLSQRSEQINLNLWNFFTKNFCFHLFSWNSFPRWYRHGKAVGRKQFLVVFTEFICVALKNARLKDLCSSITHEQQIVIKWRWATWKKQENEIELTRGIAWVDALSACTYIQHVNSKCQKASGQSPTLTPNSQVTSDE